MGYEINFIGVSEETKDADAIALRWEDQEITKDIGVYDGGNQKYGEELGTFLDNYFFSPKKKLHRFYCMFAFRYGSFFWFKIYS